MLSLSLSLSRGGQGKGARVRARARKGKEKEERKEEKKRGSTPRPPSSLPPSVPSPSSSSPLTPARTGASTPPPSCRGRPCPPAAAGRWSRRAGPLWGRRDEREGEKRERGGEREEGGTGPPRPALPSTKTKRTGVGVSQQGADGQQDLGNGQGGRPLLLEDVLLRGRGKETGAGRRGGGEKMRGGGGGGVAPTRRRGARDAPPHPAAHPSLFASSSLSYQADGAIGVDVAVVDAGLEGDLGGEAREGGGRAEKRVREVGSSPPPLLTARVLFSLSGCPESRALSPSLRLRFRHGASPRGACLNATPPRPASGRGRVRGRPGPGRGERKTEGARASERAPSGGREGSGGGPRPPSPRPSTRARALSLSHLGCLERVVRREMDVQEEDAALVGRAWGRGEKGRGESIGFFSVGAPLVCLSGRRPRAREGGRRPRHARTRPGQSGALLPSSGCPARQALLRSPAPFSPLERRKKKNAPLGPRMVDTHSKMLSPLGPAEQLQGGSREISASSLEMRLAAEDAMVCAGEGDGTRGSKERAKKNEGVLGAALAVFFITRRFFSSPLEKGRDPAGRRHAHDHTHARMADPSLVDLDAVLDGRQWRERETGERERWTESQSARTPPLLDLSCTPHAPPP